MASSSRKSAERIGIGGVFGRLEADLHVALGGEVVDLVGLVLLDEADEVGRIGQVAIVHEEARLALMRIDVEIIDTGRVEGRGAPLDAVDRCSPFAAADARGKHRPGL